MSFTLSMLQANISSCVMLLWCQHVIGSTNGVADDFGEFFTAHSTSSLNVCHHCSLASEI